MIGEPRVQRSVDADISNRAAAPSDRVWQEGIAAGLLGRR